jgi:hypothetical protein
MTPLLLVRKLLLPSTAMALGLLSGCALPCRAPSETAHLKLERVHSGRIIIDGIFVEKNSHDKGLYLTGSVVKRLGILHTADTHLDVIVKDLRGRVLQARVTTFSPRELRRKPRLHQPVGTYSVRIDPLPVEASIIEVRAHDEKHTGDS